MALFLLTMKWKSSVVVSVCDGFIYAQMIAKTREKKVVVKNDSMV
jgi:hypothetical protein